MRSSSLALALAAGMVVGACGGSAPDAKPVAAAPEGVDYVVRDTVVVSLVEASGTAEPIRKATLSTKLMGTVTAVLVTEGQRVAAGQPLVLIDQRDLDARAGQAEAALAEAEAVRRDAGTQAGRIRSLFADSAATRAQLDAAETGLARATAGVAQARAAAAELSAVRGYARVVAPFAGVVTRRFVDPGAFASPGVPLVSLEDGTQLRVSATASPDLVRGLRPGMTIMATIEGKPVSAKVEGTVPTAGAVYRVNALLDNRAGAYLPGSAATLALASGQRKALLVPATALVHEGDLTGVRVRRRGGTALRWVRVGEPMASGVEVLSGLSAGDVVQLPPGDNLAEVR